MSVGAEESPDADRSREAAATASPEKKAGISTRIVAAGQIAAAVTALVTVAAFAWHLVLRPASTPPVIRAEAKDVEVHPGVTLRTYLSDRPGPLERFLAGAHAGHDSQQEIDEVLATEGTELEFTVAVDGGLHRTLSLVTSVYNAKSHARIPQGEVEVQDPKHYRAEAESFQSTVDTWIQTPPRRGSYYAEVDIEEAGGRTLATAKSAAFAIP